MGFTAIRPLLFAALAISLPLATTAQTLPAQIDAGHSYATIWMGRNTEVSRAVNTGVAHVGGTAQLDTAKTAPATLEIALVPGGAGARLLTPQGTLRSGEIAAILRYVVMSFHSTATRVRSDGLLELSGALTATHVTREQIKERWSWAYNGSSTYTDPESRTVTRQAKFVVLSPHAEFVSNFLKENREITVAATIDVRDFPELPDFVLASDWPIVEQDRQCPDLPPEGGRADSNSLICGGKAISVTNPPSERHSFSVDFAGMRRAYAPVEGPVTILLHLRFPSLAVPPPPLLLPVPPAE